jgi:hypothetical protein
VAKKSNVFTRHVFHCASCKQYYEYDYSGKTERVVVPKKSVPGLRRERGTQLLNVIECVSCKMSKPKKIKLSRKSVKAVDKRRK